MTYRGRLLGGGLFFASNLEISGSMLTHRPGMTRTRRVPDGQFAHGHPAQFARRANMSHVSRLRRRANHKHLSAHPAAFLQRGVSRSSRTLAVGCGGRGLASDDRRGHVRRSRVVLAPRRWRQARKDAVASCGRRGQESPVPGESTKDTVKTIAQGRPDDWLNLW